MADRALDGLKILEYGDMVTAPYATKLLADLGAEVIKMEPPAGDAARRRGPFPGDEPHPEKSGLFLYLNANKRGVTLDLDSSEDRARFDDLVRWCDIFVHNVDPARALQLGWSYEALARLNPRLVMTSVTRFGMTGPYRDYKGYELTSMHGGGWGWLGPGHLEDPELPPLKNFGLQGDIQTAMSAANATLAAAFATRFAGAPGQHIDVSAFETLADNKYNSGIHAYLVTGMVPDRFGKPVYGPSGVVKCSDGYLFLLIVEQYQWQNLLDIIGREEWSTWEVFAEPVLRGLNNDVLMPLVAEKTQGFPRMELYERLQTNRIPAAPLFDVADILQYEQLQTRGFWEQIDHPVAGQWTIPGAPYKLSDTPWSIRRPAPLLGQHNDEVFAEIAGATGARGSAGGSATAQDAPASNATGSTPGRKLLEGIRVLDLTTMWAGPVSTKELGRLGADVIRLETTTRNVMPVARPHGIVNISAYTSPAGHNQGKRSIFLNLRTPEGIELARGLIAQCDIVIENFSAGAIERLGLGYQALREQDRRIIMISASGFGSYGPHHRFLSYGRPQSYLSGLVSLTGYQGGGARELGIPYGDPNAGQLIVTAALAALHHRERSGEGQWVDLSQLEAMSVNAVEGVLEYVMTGKEPARRGNRDSLLSPHNIYRCAGNDTWVSIACGTDEEWRALAVSIGGPDLAAAERFVTAALRKQHEDELDAIINDWTVTRDRYAITCSLQEQGVAAFPVMSGADLANDPHLAARGFMLEVRDQEGNVGRDTGLPWQIAGAADPLRQRSPKAGEHTREVMRELLRLSDERIAELETSGTLR